MIILCYFFCSAMNISNNLKSSYVMFSNTSSNTIISFSPEKAIAIAKHYLFETLRSSHRTFISDDNPRENNILLILSFFYCVSTYYSLISRSLKDSLL